MSRNTCGCFSFLCTYFNFSKGIPRPAALHAKSGLTLVFCETTGVNILVSGPRPWHPTLTRARPVPRTDSALVLANTSRF